MYYKDGAVYEGEWFDDKRNGSGLLRLGRYKNLPLSHLHVLMYLLMYLLTYLPTYQEPKN